MRLKFIPPFKETRTSPAEAPMWLRLLRDIEAEGLLRGVEWDLDAGGPGKRVWNREDLAQIVPAILRIVRQACESGTYDAVIILGGLEPGLYAAKEIGAQFNIPVLGTTSSQIVFAYILGNKYTIIDTLEGMAINLRQNVMAYGMNEKCASVRSIEMAIPELRTKPPEAVDAFVREAIEAVEKDGADVIVCGCTVLLLIQPLAQKRLIELGYDIPVLNGYKCAIEVAKSLVNMKVIQSKMAFPDTTPKNRAVPR